MDRKPHNWNVTLQRDDGKMFAEQLQAHWDPNQDSTLEAIGRSASVIAWWNSRQQHRFAVIGVELAAA